MKCAAPSAVVRCDFVQPPVHSEPTETHVHRPATTCRMNTIVLGYMLVAAIIIVVMVVTVRIAFTGHAEVFNRMRDQLQGVRLFRMLQRRRIDVREYLRTVDPAEIRDQIARCESCPGSAQCDTVLDSPGTAAEDYKFCPNDPRIRAMQPAAQEGDPASRGTGRR